MPVPLFDRPAPGRRRCYCPHLEPLEDRNLLAVLSTDLAGRDMRPPRVVIETPLADTTATENVRVAGRVTDDLSGVARLRAQVDHRRWFNVAFNGSGHFHFRTGLKLDGTADGQHLVRLRATDRAGNVSGVSRVPFTLVTDLVNRAVTTDAGVQQMPSVAVDPLNSRHVVIAYMDRSLVDSGYAGIGVAVSQDNGTTWQRSVVPLPAGFDEGAANPIAHFDAQGHVFVSYMAATFLGPVKPPITNGDFFNPELGASDRAPGMQANNGIFVVRSDDGGLNWAQPVAVTSHLYTGQDVPFEVVPDLAIDTFRQLPNGQANPHHGNLYVTWTRLYPPGQFPDHPDFIGGGDILIAVSADGGQTWETKLQQSGTGPLVSVLLDPAIVTDNLPGITAVDQAHLTIGPEGDVYVSNFGGGDFVVQHSTDGGASFTIPDHDTGRGIAFATGFTSFANVDGLPHNHFRTYHSRAIAADPLRPGQVYAVEQIRVLDAVGNTIDPADIFLSRSTDFGQTWQETFQVGPDTANVLNDDNGAQQATSASPNEVIVSQALPRLAVDPQGNIGVIWLDARRDPADHLLDVFGTISSDGGLSFSPNFRVTSVSFDADQGQFIDAVGKENFYLGDFLGLALENNTAYASWTDTRNGNQDVFFSRFHLDPAPAPPNDRFEPNDSNTAATPLGKVIQRVVPRLDVPAGDEDWFQVEAAATGDLSASALFGAAATVSQEELRLELWDASGGQRLAMAGELRDEAGNLIGQKVSFPGNAGQSFLVRVFHSGTSATSAVLPTSSDQPESTPYTLQVQSLTADLGTRVFTSVNGTVEDGGGALYLVTASAPGSVEVQLTNGPDVQGDLHVQVLDPSTFSSLVTSQPTLVAAPEPNDSIPQATVTGLTAPGSVQAFGTVGDGAFGQTRGDYDFYSFQADANQQITIEENTRIVSSSLDGVIGLYDSSGELLAVQDSGGPGGNEVLTFVTTRADTYTVAIFGCCAGPPADPFTPGTGGGPQSTGAYRLTITTEEVGAGAVKQVSLPVEQGQRMVLLVTGDPGSHGSFNLGFTNHDQFTTPDTASLLFPAGAGPSQAALHDLNGDDQLDLVVANAQSDTLSVLLGSGDGTFQAPRQFGIGAFVTPTPVGLGGRLGTFRRQVVVADFNGDQIPDVAVTNYDSADVSVLLGRGDGTFEPQRRFDATGAPFDLTVGDFNGDGKLDLAAVDATVGPPIIPAVLLGRGDGTFEPQQTFTVPLFAGDTLPMGTIQAADLNNDHRSDLVITGSNLHKAYVFFSNSDGSFSQASEYDSARLGVGLALGDVNEDHIVDIVATGVDDGNQASVLLGNADATFQGRQDFFAGQNPVAVAIDDVGSQLTLPGGLTALGPPDGHPDLVVAVSGVNLAVASVGPPEVVLLPGLVDAQGQFAGFGSPQRLALGKGPQDVDLGDVNGDDFQDVAVVDRDGVRVIYGQKPIIQSNDTPQTARNLGTVVHLLEPTLTIVPGHTDSYFTLTVPTESARGSADEVIDFSGFFQATEGAGIAMEVRDADGHLLGSGERFRVQAPQGALLSLHVFGVMDSHGERGNGAYTLDINVLPQVVSVEAQPLLPGADANPGGPTASLVVTLQGDRLDPDTAEDPANYTITWLGPDGMAGTNDDQVMPLDTNGRSLVYDPSTNVDVSTGTVSPTAVRQTLTFLFDQPLPAGSYHVEVAPAVQTAAFSADEADLLSLVNGLSGHPVVTRSGGLIDEGGRLEARDLVFAAGTLGDFRVFEQGTPFLGQLHDDLGALLDAVLTQNGDDPSITPQLIDQVLRRFDPALGPTGSRPAQLFVLVLDPVSVGVTDPNGDRVIYDLGPGVLTNDINGSFVAVGGNVEVLVIPGTVTGGLTFDVQVGDVPATARGAAIFLGQTADQTTSLTEALRGGTTAFSFSFP